MAELIILKSHDGQRLCLRSWDIENPKAVIFALHGIGDDGTIFENFAKEANRKGYAVFAPDLRGYGCSGRERGDAKIIDQLKDIHLLVNHVRSLHPDSDIILVGYSLGCGYAILYQRVYKNKYIKAIVLLAPPAKLPFKFDKRIAIMFLIFLVRALFLPRMKVNLALFMTEDVAKSHIGQEFIRNMRIVKRYSLRYLLQMSFLIDGALMLNALRIEKPVLIIQGTEDSIVDYKGALDLYTLLIRSKERQLILLEGLDHDLGKLMSYKAPTRKGIEVANTILEWVDEVISVG